MKMATMRFFTMQTILLIVCIFCLTESAVEQRRFLTQGSFLQAQITGVVTDHKVEEASGCAASRIHPGLLYTINDHSGKTEVYVLATNGTLVATYDIHGAHNRDWEDIAVGPCDANANSADCIYIGDTGNTGSENKIYRVEEPYFVEDRDIEVEAELKFSWNEDDCETIMVDPQANVYLISKDNHGRGVLVKLPNSAWAKPGHSHRVPVSSTNVVSAPSTHHDPVGGDISPNGDEVLVKVHEGIYYWDMNGSRNYSSVMATRGANVSYHHEPQGEAVCWDARGSGYYTLSEGANQPIYYYARA